MIPKETVDEIMQTARIEEVVGDFVNLKRAGSSLKGLSPFTDEKTPSFFVSPAKQIFKCFSSGKGGTVVSFLMDHEHFSYPEALRWLADKYGIEIPEKEATPEELAQRNERESLYLVNKFAQEYFTDQLLNTDEGKSIGLSYFKGRGYTVDIVEKFQLGYNPEEGEEFTKAALNAGYKKDYLEKTGLTKSKGNRSYDFFRGRVMFPIHNLTGRVLGFGGRTLRKDKKTAKYFNSPESPIYNKSKVLYGLFFAKNAIIKYDACYLVEGYTDVISLHQNGVENVVSSSGTALTKDQIRLIKRYSENITILYDGDEAGIRASFRGIDLILEEGMNVRIVLFPDGEDPDSFAQSSTEEEIKEYVQNNARDFISFKTDILHKESKADPVKRAGMIREIVQSIGLVPDAITRSVYVRDCSERFEMDEQTLINELNKFRRDKFNKERRRERTDEIPPELDQSIPVDRQPKPEIDEIEPQEYDIVRIMLTYASNEIRIEGEDEDGEKTEEDITIAEYIIHELEKDDIQLENELYRKIYEEFVRGLESDEVLEQAYFFSHGDAEISQLAVDMVSSPYILSQKWEDHHIYTVTEDLRLRQSTQNAIYSYKLKRVQQMLNDSQEQLKNDDLKEEDVEAILHKQTLLLEIKRMLSEELGRIVVK